MIRGPEFFHVFFLGRRMQKFIFVPKTKMFNHFCFVFMDLSMSPEKWVIHSDIQLFVLAVALLNIFSVLPFSSLLIQIPSDCSNTIDFSLPSLHL